MGLPQIQTKVVLATIAMSGIVDFFNLKFKTMELLCIYDDALSVFEKRETKQIIDCLVCKSLQRFMLQIYNGIMCNTVKQLIVSSIEDSFSFLE